MRRGEEALLSHVLETKQGDDSRGNGSNLEVSLWLDVVLPHAEAGA